MRHGSRLEEKWIGYLRERKMEEPEEDGDAVEMKAIGGEVCTGRSNGENRELMMTVRETEGQEDQVEPWDRNRRG